MNVFKLVRVHLHVVPGNFFFLFFFVLGHMEVPRLGVESELEMLAYTTATAMADPSHSSWQRWSLNPLSEARNQTCSLMDARRILVC